MKKEAPHADQNIPTHGRDQIHINLLGLSPRLRALAAREGLSVGCAARIAISRMLDDEADAATADEEGAGASDSGVDAEIEGDIVRVLLRIPRARAELLVSRARARGVSRSRYVDTLMDGVQPAPLPSDHAAMVAALMSSTDQIAALSRDLRDFVRLLGIAPTAELEPYRARVASVVEDVLAQLKPAATLLAELESTRRWR